MQAYSILIACDQLYYDDWGIGLLKSINHHSPWIKLRCHVVNPINLEKLEFVEYTVEEIEFQNDEVKIAYLQAVRFIAASKIPMNESFITLDADTICTRSFTEEEFATLFDAHYVMQHPKDGRWLAGLVTFGQDDFRHQYAKALNSKPIRDWKWGRDQLVMPQLDNEYNFMPVGVEWITVGKNKNDSAFLTLKGDQKTTDKYLEKFIGYRNMATLEEHLGGHANKTHLDKGALLWAAQELNSKSFLDIGCGPGGMVQLAEEQGFKSFGVDGDYTLDRYNADNFLIHDFTTGPAPLTKKYDLGWSVEFVEHVYEEYIPNYMQAFQCCKSVIMTYAPPGWAGHHHVNLQEEQYWIDTFAEYNLIYDKLKTKKLREHSTMNTHKRKKAFVRNRGLVFVNENF